MVFVSEEEQIKKFYQDPLIQENFQLLRELIAKRSVFAQQVGLEEVADYLGQIFIAAGAKVQIDKSYQAPFVIAEFKSSNPHAKSIIFYQHYDTVPADGDQAWTEDPFSLFIQYDHLFGRGVDDDKGHIIARLTAVRRYLNQHGDLPVHITFIMEGAEESASVDLDKYLKKYKKQLKGADLLVWEQGRRDASGRLEITGGTKGIVTFDMVVKSADVDIHSSFGGVVDSASWYLLNALHSLRDETGRILVDGLYDDIIEPNQRELDLLDTYINDDYLEFRDIYGLELPLLVEEKAQFLKRFYFEPALNIEGLGTGYQGKGVKTILPADAFAKVEVRLVPGLEPADVLAKIDRQLKKNGFDKVELIYTLGEKSYRSDMSDASILNVIRLAKDFYPEGVSVLPTTPGTGPMHTVYEALQCPIAAFGIGNANSRDHGGDENVKISDYVTHIELVEEIIDSYDQSNH